MPSVLDSFVLEIGIDPTKFTAGQRQAMDSLRKLVEGSRREGNAIEAQTKRLLKLLSTVRRVTIGSLAAFLGGAESKKLFDHIINLDAATGRFSRTIGMNVREVSAWQGAFQQIGGTAEGANAALGGLSQEMSRFQLTGQSTILPVLSRLGISLYDQNRNLKTAGELWLELADAVQGMDPRQAVAFLQMIPGANQDMINFALLGRRAMEQYLDAARQTGTTTAESAAAAQEYQASLVLLDRSAQGLGRTLVTFLAPALSRTFEAITRILQAMRTGESGGGAFATGNASSFGKSLWNMMMLGLAPATGGLSLRLASPYGDNAEAADRMTAARRLLNEKLLAAASRVPATGSTNWDNFLSGLSYLETSQTGAPSGTSSARGYFQFLSGTAAKAKGAGLPDPRSGSYGQQASATMQYIKKFHPEAAAAIDRGDYATATMLLRGEWPSLPGGGQPQSAARYATFAAELAGGGPRASGGATTVNIDAINVNAPHATDAEGVAREIGPALKRSLTAGAANTGPQ